MKPCAYSYCQTSGHNPRLPVRPKKSGRNQATPSIQNTLPKYQSINIPGQSGFAPWGYSLSRFYPVFGFSVKVSISPRPGEILKGDWKPITRPQRQPSLSMFLDTGKTFHYCEIVRFQRYIKFVRITMQGIAIASLGTMGMNPAWGAFIVGIGAFIVSLAFLAFERED